MITPSLRQIENDVWFRWVAPSTAVYQVNTNHVPPTNGATAVAVYKFGCPTGPGRAIAGRMGAEVGGGLWAYPSFGAEAGIEYLIRVGNTVSQNHTNGIFTIEEMSPPDILTTAVNPDNGHTYHMLEPSDWSEARTAALELGGDLVTVNDQAENDWLMSTFFSFEGKNRSLWLGYNDAETEGIWRWANGETPGYENWSPGEPSNGRQSAHYAHLRYDWSDGTWNDTSGFPGSNFFYDEVHGIVEIGSDEIENVPFHRGDPNDDGGMNLTDAVFILNHLFLAGAASTCLESADVNDDGGINLTDAVFILNFLFLAGDQPAPPGHPDQPCGTDPAGSPDLGCEVYDGC